MLWIIAMLAFWNTPAYAHICKKIVAGTNNVPTDYSTAAGSLIISGLEKGIYKNINVVNNLSADMCFTWTEGARTTAPVAANNTQEKCLPSSIKGWQSEKNAAIVSPRIYIRSYSGGTLSSGWAQVCVDPKLD